MSLKTFLASFWARYKKWIIAALIAYAAITAALVFLTRGPQSEPFVYQVF